MLHENAYEAFSLIALASAMDQEMQLHTLDPGPQIYESVQISQRATDDTFDLLYPQRSRQLDEYYGPPTLRWERTLEVARSIYTLLDSEAHPSVHMPYRAKSNHSIDTKMGTYGLDPDEIFDIHGVRCIVPTIDDARSVSESIRRRYSLMQPRRFRHFDGVHSPYRDTLENPKPDTGYAAIHMNLMTRQGLVEVQISTIPTYQHMFGSALSKIPYQKKAFRNIGE